MEKQKHIVILADPLDDQNAGVHRYVSKFLEALDQEAFPYMISILRQENVNDYLALKTITISRPKNLIEKAWRYFYRIPRKMAEVKADMVIEMAHFGPFNLSKKIKRAVFLHDLTPVLFPEFHTGMSSVLQRLFLPGISKRSDWVLCNSEYTKKDIERLLKPSCSITALRPGYDASFYFDDSPLSNDLKFLNDHDFILSVGTLEPRKNLEVLIDSFEQIKSRGWAGYLVLTGGKGWRDEALKNRINTSLYKNDIILTGFVSNKDLRRLYSKCSVFVYPSLYEGFGLPILEALSCGAKVVASSSSSLPEAGGAFAQYINPKSSKELIECVEQRLSEDHDREASINFAKSYSWNQTARKFLEELASVLD